jgi:cbb3-type cytochrome oxidase subunit 1
MVLFPLAFLTLLGLIGVSFLGVIVQNSLVSLLTILILFGLTGIATINVLAKKENTIFSSAQHIYGAIVILFVATVISRSSLEIYSDQILVSSLTSSLINMTAIPLLFMSAIYFLMTKGLGATLYSKTLSSISFWGFLFLLPWTSFKYYYGSVLPNWLENVSIYLSLSLIVPLLAFVVNFIQSSQDNNDRSDRLLSQLNFSMIVFTVTTALHIASSFANLLPILGLTNFVYAIKFGYLSSLIIVVMSLVLYLIPKLFGREVSYTNFDKLGLTAVNISLLLYLVNNLVIGINSGYSWNAGANAGNPTIYGEGFQIQWELISVNFMANTFISLLFFASAGLYFITTVKAISSGAVTTVEEMVSS